MFGRQNDRTPRNQVYFGDHKKTRDTGGDMQLTDYNNLPEYAFPGKKFLRREELTASIRSYIAVQGFLAMQNSQRGLITHLSRQFNRFYKPIP